MTNVSISGSKWTDDGTGINPKNTRTIGVTGNRVSKGWFTDLEITNGLPNSDVIQQVVGSPTYTSLRDERNAAGSAGWISGGTISNATGGTFDVSAGTGWLRDATGVTDDIFSIDWPASLSISIADGVIYGVYVNYNAGTPVVAVTDITVPATFVNLKTTFLLGLIAREGTTYTYQSFQTRAGDIAALTNAFASGAFSKPRANNTGLIISTDASLSLTLSAGTVFVGLNAVAHAGTSTFDEYYTSDSGATWTRTASQTLFDETQYNTVSSGLSTLSANKWGVHWVYGNLDGTMSVVFGQAEYANEASAQASTTPTILPPKLKSQLSWLVGRIVFKKSAGATAEMESVYGTSFVGGAAANHANLTNLAWTSSLHTGTASNIAGFSGAGAAAEYTLSGTGTVLPTTTSPTFVTPILGTPTSGVMTNVTGTAASLTAGAATLAISTSALTSATTTVNVDSATASTTGQVLTATGAFAATWQTASGGGATAVALIPVPTGYVTQTETTLATNTAMHVGLLFVQATITVNKISVTAANIYTAGTYDIVVYTEDGQTQKISVTTASISGGGAVSTAVSSVELAAGMYYFAMVPNSTASVKFSCWTFNGMANLVTSEPDGSGTVTVSAGAPAATFDPTSDISGDTIKCPIFKLDT